MSCVIRRKEESRSQNPEASLASGGGWSERGVTTGSPQRHGGTEKTKNRLRAQRRQRPQRPNISRESQTRIKRVDGEFPASRCRHVILAFRSSAGLEPAANGAATSGGPQRTTGRERFLLACDCLSLCALSLLWSQFLVFSASLCLCGEAQITGRSIRPRPEAALAPGSWLLASLAPSE